MRGLVDLLDHHLEAASWRGLGYGPDPYSEDPVTHPMAVAMYLRGLAALARVTDRQDHHDASRRELVRLLDLRGPDGGWGLGFTHWGRGGDTSYAITTAIAGRALAEHVVTTDDPRAAAEVAAAADWLIDYLPWAFQRPGACPWYAPTLNQQLPNVAAMVGGFLHQAATLTGEARYRPPARAALRFVLSRQRPDGEWTYGGRTSRRSGAVRAADTVDLLHMGYVLEGLGATIEWGDACDAAALRRARARGQQFVERWLVGPGGRCWEKVVPVDPSDPLSATLLDNPRLEQHWSADTDRCVVRFPAESRLWGYGAILGAAARGDAAAAVGGGLNESVLARLLAVHMIDLSGRFRYLADDRAAYPRHESHLFEALSSLVASAGDVRHRHW